MKRKLRLIIMAFAISFVIMATLSLYSLRQFSALTGYSNQVDHTNRVITQLYRLQSLLKEMDYEEQAFMLTGDSNYVKQIYTNTNLIQPVINNINLLTNNNDIQANTFIMLRSAITLRMSDIKDNLKYLDTVDAARTHISPFYIHGTQIKDEAVTHISEMLNRESKMLQEKFENKKYYEQITTNTLVYLLLVFGIVTITLFLVMVKELKVRLGFQEELQNRLVDLKRSHAELEQIAFAASHDLQEPLRKIRIFSNRLSWLKRDENEESRDTVERINSAAERMQELIDDMVNLTSLIKEEGEKQTVDLNNSVRLVLKELEDKVTAQQAIIHREVLPEIKGYQRQFHILFKSLLDNSLKFTREGVQPVIAIRADKTLGEELRVINQDLIHQHFHRITVSDNGIGFDNKFISKIFRIFQRLHNQESDFEGKGIGLAICQRIMANHGGFIIASGHPEAGATFKLFFPIED